MTSSEHVPARLVPRIWNNAEAGLRLSVWAKFVSGSQLTIKLVCDVETI